MTIKKIMNEIEERLSISIESEYRNYIFDATTYDLCKGITAMYACGLISSYKYYKISDRLYDIENEIKFYYEFDACTEDKDKFYKQLIY